MTPQHLLTIFIIFSVVGWIIDTSYRSALARKYASGTKYFFDPVYGVGGVVLSQFYSEATFYVPCQILIAGLLLTFVELLAGMFIVAVLKKRIWDYGGKTLNFMGHIDVLHSIYWILLALAYYLLGKLVPLY